VTRIVSKLRCVNAICSRAGSRFDTTSHVDLDRVVDFLHGVHSQGLVGGLAVTASVEMSNREPWH
jgi:hypothetical protein